MAKISELTNEEREIHISQDRSRPQEWEIYTDDPIWIRKLEGMGITADKTTSGGGKFYTVERTQITIRKKREISVERREELSQRAKVNFGR